MFPLISSPKSWFARPPPPPPDTAALASLSTLFLSFNGLSDWFKLIVVGGLLETLRRLLFSLWQYVVSCIWITAEFEQDDDPFGAFDHTYPIQILIGPRLDDGLIVPTTLLVTFKTGPHQHKCVRYQRTVFHCPRRGK